MNDKRWMENDNWRSMCNGTQDKVREQSRAEQSGVEQNHQSKNCARRSRTTDQKNRILGAPGKPRTSQPARQREAGHTPARNVMCARTASHHCYRCCCRRRHRHPSYVRARAHASRRRRRSGPAWSLQAGVQFTAMLRSFSRDLDLAPGSPDTSIQQTDQQSESCTSYKTSTSYPYLSKTGTVQMSSILGNLLTWLHPYKLN